MNKRKKTGRTSRPVLINQLTRVLKPFGYTIHHSDLFKCGHYHWFRIWSADDRWRVYPLHRPYDAKGNSLTEIWKNKGVVYYLRCSDVQELVLKLLKHEIIKTKENVKAERKETFKPERRARL